RRLVLLVRETPLHLGHLRSMAAVTEMGAIVMPPVPAFYTEPKTIEDIVNHTVGRALDLFGLDTGLLVRWGEAKRSARAEPKLCLGRPGRKHGREYRPGSRRGGAAVGVRDRSLCKARRVASVPGTAGSPGWRRLPAAVCPLHRA